MAWTRASVSFPQLLSWERHTSIQLHGNSNNHYLCKTLDFLNLGLCECLYWEHEEHVFQVLVICCAVRERLESSLANTADPKLQHWSSRHSLLWGATPAPLARTNFHQENSSVIQFSCPHPEGDHPKEKKPVSFWCTRREGTWDDPAAHTRSFSGQGFTSAITWK